MSIIKDDIERQFRAAVSGQAFGKIASVGGMALPSISVNMPERRLPKMGAESRVSAGRSSYAQYLQQREALVRTGAGGADVTQSPPEIRNPLLSLINFHLPYDRKTLAQWIRYYARTDPYVNNCLNLNGQFPISDFHFSGISDPQVLQQFEELKERGRILQHMLESSREEEEMGEVYTFWQWDEEERIWSDYTIINPDRLEVQEINWGSGMNAFYSLDPPEELKALQRDNDPIVQEMLAALDPVVLEALTSNRRVPLDPFNVMALVRKASPYDARGTSPVLPALKALMYKDKLIEAQYAIADQQITPVQLWKIGDPANGYMPTDADLANFRAVLEAGKHDPVFTIVSHSAVNLELIGYTGKLLPIIPELEWVAKQIMIALYTNEATITGAGPSFGAAVVPFKILQGRYQSKRNRMAEAYKKKLFKPFAEARGIYKTTQAELSHRIRTRRQPLVPDLEWNFKLDLTDSAQKLQYMMQLREKNQLAARTVCEVLNVDYEANKKALKDEEGTVYDPVYQDSRKERAKAAGTAAGALEGVGAAPGGGAGAPPAGGAPAAGGEPAGGAPEASPPAGGDTT